MSAPRLHTSTELIVTRAGGSSVDQALARALSGQDVHNGVAQNASLARAGNGPATPATTSATASILRPAVQHRPEWAQDLAVTAPFVLPPTFIAESDTASSGRVPCAATYTADRYDLLWVTNWARTYGSDGLPECAPSSSSVSSATRVPDSQWDTQRAHLNVLEHCFTALEVAAHASPTAPIDSIPLRLAHGTLSREGSPAALEAIRAYWVAKRHALGSSRPLIPALHVNVTHEFSAVGAHVELLGDCPLPFKQREWSAPVVRRKAYSTSKGKGCPISDAQQSVKQRCDVAETARQPELVEAGQLIDHAARLSEAVHTRETLRHRHTQLALYEMALLRQGNRVKQVSEGSWQRLRLVLKRNREMDN